MTTILLGSCGSVAAMFATMCVMDGSKEVAGLCVGVTVLMLILAERLP